MKRIAIVTSGILPVPAVQGGAVENLVDFYLAENEKSGRYDITVYSVYDARVERLVAGKKFTRYHFVPINSLLYRIRRKIFQRLHKEFYYNYHLEYFLHTILKDIKRQRYDMVLFENRPGFVLPVSEVTDAKLVLHLHNDLLNATTPYSSEIFGRLHGVLTVSDYIKGRVQTIRPDEKVRTVHNGINLTDFRRNDDKSLRAELGLQADDFVLIFSGRIIPEKGIKELIEAMAMLRDEPRVKLLILGGGFFGDQLKDNDYIAHIKQLALPIKERIVFSGFVDYAKVPSYLNIADVAVIPSMWDDPFPTTVLEAMAMGLPVLATVSGGIPEEVDADCSILLPRDASLAERLAGSILQLSRDEALCRRMGEAALRRSKQFPLSDYAKHFLGELNV